MRALDSPKKLWASMTAADRALSASILAVSLVWGMGARSPAEGAIAVVTLGREECARVSLSSDRRIPLHGRLGPIDLEVREGAVAIVRSDCPNHLCVAMGWKRRDGDLLACVPNELIVRIEGGVIGERAPDAIAR
jgi:hypothetical protein